MLSLSRIACCRESYLPCLRMLRLPCGEAHLAKNRGARSKNWQKQGASCSSPGIWHDQWPPLPTPPILFRAPWQYHELPELGALWSLCVKHTIKCVPGMALTITHSMYYGNSIWFWSIEDNCIFSPHWHWEWPRDLLWPMECEQSHFWEEVYKPVPDSPHLPLFAMISVSEKQTLDVRDLWTQ